MLHRLRIALAALLVASTAASAADSAVAATAIEYGLLWGFGP
jgi:hypothetical protein